MTSDLSIENRMIRDHNRFCAPEFKIAEPTSSEPESIFSIEPTCPTEPTCTTEPEPEPEPPIEDEYDTDGDGIVDQRVRYWDNNNPRSEVNYNKETHRIENIKRYDQDGKLESIKEFTYSDDGKTENSVTKDLDGNILETHECVKNDNGDFVRLLTKDAEGNITGSICEYNEDGTIKSSTELIFSDHGWKSIYNSDGSVETFHFDRPTPDVISAEEGIVTKHFIEIPKYAKDGTATYRRIELPISEEEGSNSKNDEGFFDKISRYGEEIISGILNFLGIKN